MHLKPTDTLENPKKEVTIYIKGYDIPVRLTPFKNMVWRLVEIALMMREGIEDEESRMNSDCLQIISFDEKNRTLSVKLIKEVDEIFNFG